MRIKPSELNTDRWSPERIWVRDTVGRYGFNSNDPLTSNSIDATIKFLESIKVKAAQRKFVDVVVDFEYDEGDENNLSSTCLSVRGMRMETDSEYESRLSGEFFHMKRSIEEHERKAKYYASEDYAKRVKTLETALAAIRNKEPNCH